MHLLHWLTPTPVQAYGERTMMYVPQRDRSQPSSLLLDLAIKSISRAREISLEDLVVRQTSNATDYPDLWPGEHYRLLGAIVDVMRPAAVIEIGTYQGLSALSLKKFLPPNGEMTTFDVVPWTQIGDTCLRMEDFADGRLTQKICDLANPDVFKQSHELLASSQLIFLDGPKDGFFEKQFLKHLSEMNTIAPKVLVFDDIRTWNMLTIWREIAFPKLDLTSFGHWTGTGLVDWNPNA